MMMVKATMILPMPQTPATVSLTMTNRTIAVRLITTLRMISLIMKKQIQNMKILITTKNNFPSDPDFRNPIA